MGRVVVLSVIAVFLLTGAQVWAKESGKGKGPTPNKNAYERASDMAKFKRTGEVSKDAEKAAKKAEKEAEIAKRKAEKEAARAKKEAEKAARKAEQEAKKKQREMEREAKKTQKRLGR